MMAHPRRFDCKSKSPRSTKSNQFRLHRALRCERLEDRRVLAIITVTTDQDVVEFTDGVTSLREAVFAANTVPGADEIVFDFGHDSPAMIWLEHGQFQITDELIITGAGPELLTIDAQSLSRVLYVDGRSTALPRAIDVTLRGVTITHGFASPSSTTSGHGGGILFESTGVLSVENSRVHGNTAVLGQQTQLGGEGGGIYSYGTVVLEDSEIRENVGDGVSLFDYFDSSNLLAIRSRVEDNSQLGISGWRTNLVALTESSVSGNYGGGVGNWIDNVVAVDSTIADNGGATSSLGGIAITGNIELRRSHVTGNSSDFKGGGLSTSRDITVFDSVIMENNANAFASGGGIGQLLNDPLQVPGKLTIVGSTISNNSAGFRGGGIYALGDALITDSVISGNHADSVGGGVFGGDRASLTISTSTIDGNSARGLRSAGAGITAYGDLTLRDSVVSNNNRDFDSTARFGGIASKGNTAKILNSTITGNQHGGVGASGTVYVAHSTIAQNPGYGVIGRDVRIDHSIVAAIAAPTEGRDVFGNNSLDVSYSLIGNNVGTNLPEAPVGQPDANGNLIGGPIHGLIDPLLAPLANNGGPTFTHALLPGSPAINAGIPDAVPGNNSVPEFDQRGLPYTRVADGRIDIGAFELQSPAGDLNGDFDSDGDVDGSDFLAWQRGFGTTNTAVRSDGDATGNHSVDGYDLAVWQATFGQELAAISSHLSAPPRGFPVNLGFGTPTSCPEIKTDESDYSAQEGSLSEVVTTRRTEYVSVHRSNWIDQSLRETYASMTQLYANDADGEQLAAIAALDDMFSLL